MEQTNGLVVCTGLTKTYGSLKALDNLNLAIGPGRFVGLLGPNGSGKTTLIKLINGLIQPTSGTVTVDGHLPGVYTHSVVSYLPDRAYLNDWMRVCDLIDFYADFYTDFDRVKANEMLSTLNIQSLDRLKTLSKGTKEKVRLILAMSRKAELYLLDEPENSLAPQLQEQLLHFLEDSARFYHCQFVISTHSPFLLSMRGARIYDLDANPVAVRRWTQLEHVQAYYRFFAARREEFEDKK